MSVPDVVRKLVERFEEHEAEYRHSYSEAQVRQDFIDPLFEALGWEVENWRSELIPVQQYELHRLHLWPWAAAPE